MGELQTAPKSAPVNYDLESASAKMMSFSSVLFDVGGGGIEARRVVKMLKAVHQPPIRYPANRIEFAEYQLDVLRTIDIGGQVLDELVGRIDAGWTPADRGEIAQCVALLVCAYPNAKIPEPEVFTRMLVEDLLATGAPSFVIESACTDLRRHNKFIPAIAEVLASVAEWRKTWDRRRTAGRTYADRHAAAVRHWEGALEKLGTT